MSDPNGVGHCGSPCRSPIVPYTAQAAVRYGSPQDSLPDEIQDVAASTLWGDRDIVRERLDGSAFRVLIDRECGMWISEDPISDCSNPRGSSSLCPADLNDDGSVDYLDLIQLLSFWSQGDLSGDVDCSASVGLGDLILLISTWGACP